MAAVLVVSFRARMGTTDPITGMIADWTGMIITAYVGGRSIEKVARIFRRCPNVNDRMNCQLSDLRTMTPRSEAPSTWAAKFFQSMTREPFS
jgi:hypothetical protein